MTEAPKKKTRRKRAENGGSKPHTVGLHPKEISPKTENQRRAFDGYYSGRHLMLHGMAGTGKTLLSLYLALKDIEAGIYKKMVIVRSAVPTRDMGFMPGNLKEKGAVYEGPFMGACAHIYDRADAYEILKQWGVVQFSTTSFIRGITLDDTIIILDEIQNMKFHELDSVITRTGKNSRIIAIGDFKQSDLVRQDEKNGILDFLRVAQEMKSFDLIEFGYDDILRSPLVKEYLIVRDRLGISN